MVDTGLTPASKCTFESIVIDAINGITYNFSKSRFHCPIEHVIFPLEPSLPSDGFSTLTSGNILSSQESFDCSFTGQYNPLPSSACRIPGTFLWRQYTPRCLRSFITTKTTQQIFFHIVKESVEELWKSNLDGDIFSTFSISSYDLLQAIVYLETQLNSSRTITDVLLSGVEEHRKVSVDDWHGLNENGGEALPGRIMFILDSYCNIFRTRSVDTSGSHFPVLMIFSLSGLM